MSFEEHRESAPKELRVAVVTISDKRWKGEGEDLSGKILEEGLRKQGFEVERYLLPNDREEIVSLVRKLAEREDVDAIITTGGTGISSRDVTIESLKSILEKELPGFGEILRYLGYQRVGTPALLSRATAGVYRKKLVFCLPGAPNAVAIGLEVLLPELPHLVKHAKE